MQLQLLVPELIIASLKELGQSTQESSLIVEQRARLIEKIFVQLVKQIITPPTHPKNLPPIHDWQFWLPTSLKKSFYPDTKIKPIHPWTPDVQIGIKNQQTVIYITEELDLRIPSQSIVTVTKFDAQANGTNIETLAKIWQNHIQLSFSNAFWGYEFDQQYPLGRWFLIGIIIIVTFIFIWFTQLIRDFLRRRKKSLKFLLHELTESLTDKNSLTNQEEINEKDENIEQDENLINSDNFQEKVIENNEINQNQSTPSSLDNKLLNKNGTDLVENLQKQQGFINQFIIAKKTNFQRQLNNESRFFLSKQNVLRQQINVFQLLLRILLIIKIFFLSLGIIIALLTFRETRFLSIYFLKETLLISIMWLILIFLDKLGDFLIDYLLNRWASEAQTFNPNPNSNRYTLRAETYSSSLKKASSFFTVILGIYLAIWLLGVNPAFLTGAGFLAVGLAFLSRNLLEDLLNGALILVTDRYVIGDVIDLGNGMAGAVEEMNLFITSLRNLDGQLIAIPNSQITNVINNTKYWSRVNFTIKIGFQENVEKAIDIMVEVANKMQEEVEWQDSFLEPIQVLGVDELSYEGIIVRCIIKTAPSKHWALGREFRSRVKKAFESANISLGIPHHRVSLITTNQKKSDRTQQ